MERAVLFAARLTRRMAAARTSTLRSSGDWSLSPSFVAQVRERGREIVRPSLLRVTRATTGNIQLYLERDIVDGGNRLFVPSADPYPSTSKLHLTCTMSAHALLQTCNSLVTLGAPTAPAIRQSRDAPPWSPPPSLPPSRGQRFAPPSSSRRRPHSPLTFFRPSHAQIFQQCRAAGAVALPVQTDGEYKFPPMALTPADPAVVAVPSKPFASLQRVLGRGPCCP